MIDRRSFPRFKVSVEVSWKKISTKESTAQHISQTKDLSAGGASVELNPLIRPGDILLMEINSPGEEPIIVKARVAWLDQNARVPGVASPVCDGGIQFLDLADDDRVALNRLISRSFNAPPRK